MPDEDPLGLGVDSPGTGVTGNGSAEKRAKTPKPSGRGDLLPTTIKERQIVWKDGVPVPAVVPVMTKSQIEALPATVMSLPFEDPLCLEPEFQGMTNGEVAYIRRARKAAGGDGKEFNDLLDRAVGKPKTSAEVLAVHKSYEEYLNDVAEKAGMTEAVEAELADGDEG